MEKKEQKMRKLKQEVNIYKRSKSLQIMLGTILRINKKYSKTVLASYVNRVNIGKY